MHLFRRQFLTGSVAIAAAGVVPSRKAIASDGQIELKWSDLVPEEDGLALDALRDLGIVQHGQMSTPFDQTRSGIVTEEFNGQNVRIPGYLIPLEFADTGITVALLVPYVGACIHVPPPPPNQLIFVTTDTPYKSSGLFEAVYVTGLFGTSVTETMLAEVGYSIAADRIEPYG